MNTFFRKSVCLLFLLICITLSRAQGFYYKTLADELQNLKKQLIPDSRVAILTFDFKDTLQTPAVIKGETDLQDAKAEVLRFLTDKKVAFVDSIRLLPDISLGEKTWALATLSVSNLRTLPDHASELASQVMMGTPLKVLDQHENWFRVQTPEYYIGWMDSGGLQRVTQKELDRWKGSTRCVFNCMSGYVYSTSGKQGEIISDLALGDIFEAEPGNKKFLKIRIPDGRTGYVRKDDCLTFNEWSQINPTDLSVFSVARQMMGFPYLWGGTSSKAVDCSGFVKVVFYSQGIILARDASQQARYGEPVDITNFNNLQPGDLLFFGRSAQRISHVGIYTRKGSFVHASGKVHISSIVPGDSGFVPTRNLVAARRVLKSLGTEGIIRVKDHPWYNIKPQQNQQ